MTWTAFLDRIVALSPDRHDALAAAAGLSAGTWRRSWNRSLAGWLRDAEATSRYGGVARDRSPLLVITPADTPAPFLNAVAASALTGRRLVFRPSRAHRELVAIWLHEIGQALATGQLRLDDGTESSAAGILAYGADETMARIAADSGSLPVYAHGDRISVAYVAAGDQRSAVAIAARLVDDIVPWDGRGCLTPRIVGVAAEQVAPLAESLAAALAASERVAPRSRPPESVSAAIHEARAACRARGGRVLAAERGTSWSVLVESAARIESTPGWRTVRVSPAADEGSFRRLLEPEWRRIEAVGVLSGPGMPSQEAGGVFGDRAASLGWMQAPSLLRCQSGNPSLLDLLTDAAGDRRVV